MVEMLGLLVSVFVGCKVVDGRIVLTSSFRLFSADSSCGNLIGVSADKFLYGVCILLPLDWKLDVAVGNAAVAAFLSGLSIF